jgi:hypothetical protein
MDHGRSVSSFPEYAGAAMKAMKQPQPVVIDVIACDCQEFGA